MTELFWAKPVTRTPDEHHDSIGVVGAGGQTIPIGTWRKAERAHAAGASGVGYDTITDFEISSLRSAGVGIVEAGMRVIVKDAPVAFAFLTPVPDAVVAAPTAPTPPHEIPLKPWHPLHR